MCTSPLSVLFVVSLGAVSASLPPALGNRSFVPGSFSPAFSVPCNHDPNDALSFDPTSVAKSAFLPLVTFAWSRDDPFSTAMVSDNSSLDAFILSSPNNTHYLFTSYDSPDIILHLRDLLNARLKALQLESLWTGRLHFADAATQSITMWSSLLYAWPSAINTLSVDNFLFPRLDGRYGWCMWPDEQQTATLVLSSSDCTIPTNATAVSGNFVLMFLGDNCRDVDAVNAASNANAAGVVLVQAAGFELVVVGNQGDIDAVGIVVSMLSQPHGSQLNTLLVAANNSLSFQFGFRSVSGFFGSVDVAGKLQEVGWAKYATLQMLSWHAQYLNFASRIQAQVSSPSAIVLPILNHVVMAEQADVVWKLPGFVSRLVQSGLIGGMEVDFELGCIGPMDRDCSVWDHCITLTANCSGSGVGEDAGGPYELGRWVTAFKRRGGRWLTDITPMMPLIAYPNAQCTFSAKTEGEPWVASANLRFTEPRDNTIPFAVEYLKWPNQQTTFDSPDYNANRTVRVQVPLSPPVVKVILRAVITGHDGCEFQPTSHHFLINSHTSLNSSDIAFTQYMQAGSPLGCADQTVNGGVPNQHGTWYYGRNGWCDGLDVKPLYWDITAVLDLSPGARNDVTYSALAYDVGGLNPTNKGCGGYILQSCHVTYYRAIDQSGFRRSVAPAALVPN